MNIRLSVILMSGYGDVAMSVEAMKPGAVDFLTKPLQSQDLFDAVAAAFARTKTDVRRPRRLRR